MESEALRWASVALTGIFGEPPPPFTAGFDLDFACQRYSCGGISKGGYHDPTLGNPISHIQIFEINPQIRSPKNRP